MKQTLLAVVLVLVGTCSSEASEPKLIYSDTTPQRYELTARASEIDARAKPHPEIDFVFEKQGKPSDT